MNRFYELESIVKDMNSNQSYLPFIEKELNYIYLKNTSDIFMDAYELVESGKKNKILIGPANGFTNSLVINYILGLTTVDPIKYGLVPEFFFSMECPFFNVNLSQPLINSKPANFQINSLSILEKHSRLSTAIDYNFHPDKFQDVGFLELNFSESLHLRNFEQEILALIILNENDLINSIAISHVGLKSFHMSRSLQNENSTFDEFSTTNGILLFQEQWIQLVCSFTDKTPDESIELKRSVCKDKVSFSAFLNLFNNEKISTKSVKYLYEIIRFLPSKAHSVGEAHIISSILNLPKLS
jgi:hypothetical protein